MLARFVPLALAASLLVGSAAALQTPCGSQLLGPANPNEWVRFGLSVSQAGDLLAVGAPDDSGVAPSGGAVYLYRRVGSAWTLEQVVRTNDLTIYQYLGLEVCAGEDVVFASCKRSALSVVPDGNSSIAVIERVNGTWTVVDRLSDVGPTIPQIQNLGLAMALSDDGQTLVASDPLSYLAEFRRSPQGTWELDHVVPNASIPSMFLPPGSGLSNLLRMDLDGDRLLTTAGPDLVLVWQRGPGGWQVVGSIVSPGPGLFEFGDVAYEHPWIAVGAPYLGWGAGGVFLFHHGPGGWQHVQTLQAPGGGGNDSLGLALTFFDGRLAAGAGGQDNGPQNSGAVHLFDLDPASGTWGWTGQLDPVVPVEQGNFGGRDLSVQDGRLVVGAMGLAGWDPGSVHEFQLPVAWGHPLEGALPNSTGAVATLTARGSPVVDHGCLRLDVTRLPPGRFGYFVLGQVQDSVPLFAGSQGHLSLGLPFQRLANDLQLSGPDGRVSFAPDFQGLPPGVQFQPGETWTFQYWTRDAAPMPTSNTSNALALTFESAADPAVQWPESVVERGEATALHTFTLTLSQPVNHEVEVHYTTGGTATHLVDWRVEAPSPLVIPAFTTELEVPIVIADDALQEGDETATVTLVSPAGCVLGSLPALTIRIADDD